VFFKDTGITSFGRLSNKTVYDQNLRITHLQLLQIKLVF